MSTARRVHYRYDESLRALDLSSSTEDYDRGEKLSHYKQLPSLRAVLYVSHRRPQVTVVERDAHGWQQRECRAGEEVIISDPQVRVSVDDGYAAIKLEG